MRTARSAAAHRGAHSGSPVNASSVATLFAIFVIAAQILYSVPRLMGSGGEADGGAGTLRYAYHDAAEVAQPDNGKVRRGEVVDKATSDAEQLLQWNTKYQVSRRSFLDRMETEADHEDFHHHIFYTVDCTYHSLWQALTMEQSMVDVGQPGYISRIASGCLHLRDRQEALGTSAIGFQRFGVFFSPTFNTLPNGDYYAQYNRPNSIWYWMNRTTFGPKEQIFILLDPDMVFIRRMETYGVSRGKPAAQYYPYMERYMWENFNKTACPLCASLGTQPKLPYSLGPPWILHIDDLRLLMGKWIEIIPQLREADRGAWIIEMVAYVIAAAYYKMPHIVAYDAQVDDAGYEKNWVPDKGAWSTMPALLHYCYTWEIGKGPKDGNEVMPHHNNQVRIEKEEHRPITEYFHFSKYRVPTDWPGGKSKSDINFMSCEGPLLQEYNTIPIEARNHYYQARHGLMIKTVIPKLNEAITNWKKINCDGKKINLQKTLRVTHANYYVSKYEITGADEEKGTFSWKEVGAN